MVGSRARCAACLGIHAAFCVWDAAQAAHQFSLKAGAATVKPPAAAYHENSCNQSAVSCADMQAHLWASALRVMAVRPMLVTAAVPHAWACNSSSMQHSKRFWRRIHHMLSLHAYATRLLWMLLHLGWVYGSICCQQLSHLLVKRSTCCFCKPSLHTTASLVEPKAFSLPQAALCMHLLPPFRAINLLAGSSRASAAAV